MDMSLDPKTLGAIFSLPPEATLQGMDLLGQLQQGNQQAIQSRGLQNTFDEQMNPLKVQRENLLNQTSEAQIPGLRADSEMRQRKNQMESLLNDDQIKSLKAKYKTEELQRHSADLEALGQLSLQLAETTWANPLGAAARAKAEFERSGHGKMWNPQWDTLPPDRLAMELNHMGAGIQATNTKLVQALQTQDARGRNALQLEDRRAANRSDIEAMKIKARAELQNTKVAATRSKDPTTLQALAAKYTMQANAETDPEVKAQLFSQANDAYEAAFGLTTGRVEAGQAGKPDIGAVANLPTNPKPVPPVLGGETKPKAANKHSLSEVQKMYPGVPAEKLKEAYKKKFGVDLQ